MIGGTIRDAASVILLREGAGGPRVLMGRRHASAAFMPGMFVFPGGAVDPQDRTIAAADSLDPATAARLAARLAVHTTDPDLGPALAIAAVRELWEETGLILGRPGRWNTPPPADWVTFAATGHVPTVAGLTFIFRAITPIGFPRRFDARFFLARADALCGDPDDVSRAGAELSQVQWIALDQTHRYALPSITRRVLAEVARLVAGGPPASVPFCDGTGPEAGVYRPT